LNGPAQLDRAGPHSSIEQFRPSESAVRAASARKT